ncbi:MAG: DUF308 domain-containing protein [Candidatus Sphingomonas colombiensis]|nr:DUF308 domain-containing protein [Sphingomonas sp.]WEK43224.1 MAG: DUF308 domain-containing protein [Sphingomonas sp.]
MESRRLRSSADIATSEGSVWGWFVGIGAAAALLGLIASAHLVMATIAATYFVGAIMFAGGILQLLHALSVSRWASLALWGLSGLLCLGLAAAVLYDPLVAGRVLTLVLAILFGASGLVRISTALDRNDGGRGWLFFSGGVCVAAVAIIAWGWPFDAIWMLGLLFAVDFVIEGGMLILLGFSLKSGGI